MKISKTTVDSLNILIKIEITKDDYSQKVEATLSNYRKKASIPGFRKGNVPMGLIQKRYGRRVQMEEINEILKKSLYDFIQKEKIEHLGGPVPKSEDVDLDAEVIPFEFELGLKPKFEVSLKTKKPVTHYRITVGKDSIEKEIVDMQKHFGKITPKKAIDSDQDEITASFSDDKGETLNKTSFEVAVLSKKAQETLKGKKVGNEVEFSTKGLLVKGGTLEKLIKINPNQAKNLDKIILKIEEINSRELAKVDQKLFDKVYGEDKVKSLDEMKKKIEESYSQNFQNLTDQYLLDQVTEVLIEETKIELPEASLKKWLHTSSEKSLSKEEADKEFENSRKGLKYQLIESRVLSDNDIKMKPQEIKDFAKGYIREQMAGFGRTDAPDEQVDNIADRLLANKEEADRLSIKLLNKKLLNLYKEKANLRAKEVSFEQFIEETYK